MSRAENGEELLEIRANSFAAAFLLPDEGVRDFLQEREKGESSRSELQAYDEQSAVTGQKRQQPYVQDVEAADVVALAHHFGVSYESALYRLQNLGLLSEGEREHLAARASFASRLRWLLGAGTEDEVSSRLAPGMDSPSSRSRPSGRRRSARESFESAVTLRTFRTPSATN